MVATREKPARRELPGEILLHTNTYRTKVFIEADGRIHNACTRVPFTELANPIREGEQRRVDRLIADFREEGQGYPRGLGYRRGRSGDVAGGIWKSQLRTEITGQITLPLVVTGETDAWGDLSGEVAAAGRLISCNTDLGNSSGKKRLYFGAGVSIARTTNDSDFSVAVTTWTIPTGSARLYCMAEVYLNNLRYLGIGMEAPTAAGTSALQVSLDPTASPPVFAEVGPANSDIRDCYWMVSVDALRRTYAHIRVDDTGGWTGDFATNARDGENLVYWDYGDALATQPTAAGPLNMLKAGDQLAGVIGSRIWVRTPYQNAAADPNATQTLRYIDIAAGHQIVEVPTRTRNVTLACRYDHPAWGMGIAYSDGKAVYWTDGTNHRSLGFLRHQGRYIAVTAKALNPTGDRLGLLWQADNNSVAQWEEYVPATGAPYGGSWHAFSKEVTTAAALILPGGTERGTTAPWGAEGLRRYFLDPSATNSTSNRQLHYGVEDRSNPLTTSVGTDTFEDGPLSAEFPMFDSWGGPEEPGIILGGHFEGDSNISATSTALWEYTVDQSTYPDFATYTAVDTATVLATGGASARRFGTRVTLDHTAGGTATPNGAPFIIRGYKEPQTRWVHTIPVDVDGMDDTQRMQLWTRFGTARDASTAVRLQEWDYDGYVYVLDGVVSYAPAIPYTAQGHILAVTLRLLEAQ